jgi:hypothetical protein
VYKYRSEDYIVDVCNVIEQLQLEWTGGLDESKGALRWIGGLDSPREHQDGLMAWMSPREYWVGLVIWLNPRSTGVAGGLVEFGVASGLVDSKEN